MTKRLLVSGTDDALHNQMALLLFLAGCFKASPCFFDKIIILTPVDCALHPVLLYYIASNKISVRTLPPVPGTDRREDPYSVKLLLATLLKSVSQNIEEVLYLDPDHLVFSTPSFGVHSGNFYVSSEDYPLPLFDSKGLIVYNTSLMYASLTTWLSIADSWIANYLDLRSTVGFRHREEVAFARSTRNSSCKVIPVSPIIQGNFNRLSMDSHLFHYGGESQGTYAVKNYLSQTIRDLHAENLSRTINHALERVKQIIDQYAIIVPVI